jgi:ribosome biogenesis GTPase
MGPGETHVENLDVLGWDAFFAAGLAAAGSACGEPARVCAAHRDALELWTADGGPDRSLRACLPGHWRLEGRDPAALPAVGDWVTFERPPGGDLARVTGVLPRRSAFVRRAAGSREAAQVVAANVDTVFLVSGLDGDLNVRRLHRYLAQLHDSGARPVLLLNKADTPDDAELGVIALGELAARWPVHAVSALHGTGLDAVREHLAPGRTVALVGSSGVGKSTLANRLMGDERQATGAVRATDARGRHATTRRELMRLPGGALLLDTPGMRSLGLWDAEAGVDAVFDEVGALARTCRFRDCRHAGEPGCAVAAALADGSLDPDRVREWDALRREAAFEARKHDPRLAAVERQRWKRRTKSMRRFQED